MKKYYTWFLLVVSVGVTAFSIAKDDGSGRSAEAIPGPSVEEPRRLEVLFLGDPGGGHKPKVRFRTLRRAHGVKGINYTYATHPTVLTKENLAKYDAFMLYGNHGDLSKQQEEALVNYAEKGGACVFLHSACGCFRNSDKFVALLGAQFKSHGAAIFRPKIVKPEHQVMKGYEGFKCWDETYIHKKHNQDRVILQMREDEPWTWVRTHGKGKIFYTASGHDHRCWDLHEYHDLVYRGLMWTVGKQKEEMVKKLNLPELSYEKSSVNIVQGKNWRDDPTPRRTEGEKIPDTHFQKPLSPENSLKLAQVPVDMKVELFAAEPMIVNPIALAWDDKGRLWATEAYDYPNSFVMNSPGEDKIVILEDTDGDGKADKRKVFAGGLTIATSVVPLENGCITTDGEEMVFLEDTDGDDKSDKRHVLFKGLKIWDTHACVSNLRLGFDGWIYGTVGYSGLDIQMNGKRIKHGQGVFRFTRDGKQFEWFQATTNNTWGLGFTEEGRVMGSTANGNPSFYLTTPDHISTKAGMKNIRTPRADKETWIYPITFDHLQVDLKGRFTAAAGHAIYTARLFGKDWHNRRALICAPTGKLVSAAVVNRVGSGFETIKTEKNIYASADAWSAPVAAEVAPDGSIFVADWYNPILQHNVYQDGGERGKGNAYVSKVRDKKHGRVYRISPKVATPEVAPKLDTLENQVKALSHSNMFWRIQAQEKIAKKGKAVSSLLHELAKKDGVGKVHAIHSLARAGEDVSSYFAAKNVASGVNAAVLQYMPKTAENGLKVSKAMAALSPPDQLAALHFVAQSPGSNELKTELKKFGEGISKVFMKDPNLMHAMNAAFAIHNLREQEKSNIPRIALSESAKRGKKHYQLVCSQCHQPDGKGTPKVFPPLSGSEWLMRDPDHAVMVVLKGLGGKIRVKGKDYVGMMPGHPQLKDNEVADVVNYVRNQFSQQLGDISVKRVKAIREMYKDRKLPYTEADLLKHKSTPLFHYDFTKSLESQGKKHVAEVRSTKGEAAYPLTAKGFDFSSNNGERSAAVLNGVYLNLPNGIISDAAKSGIKHNLTIKSTFSVSENRTWGRVWDFGMSSKGEDQVAVSTAGIMLTNRATSGNLRLSVKYKGKENFIDWKPLKKGVEYTVTAHFTRHAMHMVVNGNLAGSVDLPHGFSLTQLPDKNNWLGRSQFNDELFDGKVKSLSVYSH